MNAFVEARAAGQDQVTTSFGVVVPNLPKKVRLCKALYHGKHTVMSFRAGEMLNDYASVMLQMMGNMGGQMAGGPAGGPAGSHMMPAGGMTNGSAPPTPPAEVPAAADAPAPEG